MKLLFLVGDIAKWWNIRQKIQCKAIRYQVSHTYRGSRMIDWFVESVQDSVILILFLLRFFPLKFKSFWTHTHTHAHPRSMCQLPVLRHTFHCIIRFDGRIEYEIIQLSIYYYLFVTIVTLATHFPWTSHPRLVFFFFVILSMKNQHSDKISSHIRYRR